MARACLTILACTVLAYLVLPLVIIVGSSVSNTDFLSFPPQGVTLRWFVRAFADTAYLNAFATSTSLAAAATVLAVALAVPACLAIARYDFLGKSVIENIFMSSLVLPNLVLGAALLQFGSQIGLVRSFHALLVGHIVIVFPFIVRSVLPQLSGDQKALEEASRDLGAGALSTFFLVTMPQIRSGIVSGAVLAFISSWINVELSIFNATPNLTTMPVILFNYVQYTIDPTIAAVSSITIIAAAVLILILDAVFGLDVISTRK